MTWLLQGGFECSRPFWDLMADGQLFDWLACPYAIGGLGLTGVGMFVWAGGFIGLYNWSESWQVPLTWTAIITPAMAAVLLPGSLLRRIAGLLTLVVAGLLIGIYFWWGRS
jgi:hypothetical protein